MKDPQKLADTGAAISVTLFGVSLATAVQIVQIIAGIVAIIAGIAAARYHFKNTKPQ